MVLPDADSNLGLSLKVFVTLYNTRCKFCYAPTFGRNEAQEAVIHCDAKVY